MDEIAEEDLDCLAGQKIISGENLIKDLDLFKHVSGAAKVQRKINQEVKFLKKVRNEKSIKLNHITCSNIMHFEFLVNVLQKQANVTELDCGFVLPNRSSKLRVDIICEEGSKWIKVVARNTKSLWDAIEGRGGFGAKSILEQAEEYVLAASINLHMFRPPKVVFQFLHDVDNELLAALNKIGVDVISSNILSAELFPSVSDVNVVNMDVTTMLAYVSALTNGSSNWIFKERILTEQAKWERETPLKGLLDEFLTGKRLIACKTASDSFNSIVSLLAGSKEKDRAKQLLQRIEFFPDVTNPPTELVKVKIGKSITERSLQIFSFGIKMKSLTITSNKRLVRSLRMQGVSVPVFVHQARALTELKEEKAAPAES